MVLRGWSVVGGEERKSSGNGSGECGGDVGMFVMCLYHGSRVSTPIAWSVSFSCELCESLTAVRSGVKSRPFPTGMMFFGEHTRVNGDIPFPTGMISQSASGEIIM